MSLKNILLSYNGAPGTSAAFNYAMCLAKDCDAHVTGILTHGPRSMMRSYASHIPASAVKMIEEADRDHRKQLCDQFTVSANAILPTERTHWIDEYGDADLSLMEAARTFDAVVMPQYSKDEGHPNFEVHPDVIAQNSGRPVFVVPHSYAPQGHAKRAVIAWDGRRSAARALSDAISLMAPDTRLSLLTIGEGTLSDRQSRAIVNQLERHGLFSEFLNVPRGKGVAETILETSAHKDADLLIMGAYEHAKITEDLFGGVTNTILKKARIPVLMSH